MAIILMEVVERDGVQPNSGALYYTGLSLSAGTYSDTYRIPLKDIYAIAAEISGDGVLQFTNAPLSVLDGGSPVWGDWDGSALINLGLTAFRLKRNSGVVAASVTVKTVNS